MDPPREMITRKGEREQREGSSDLFSQRGSVTGRCLGLVLVSLLFSCFMYPPEEVTVDVTGLFVVIKVSAPCE